MRVDTWAGRSQQPLENVITPHDGHHLYLRSAAPAESHHLPPPLPPAVALWLPLEILTSLGILLGIDFPWKSRHPLAEWLPLWCCVSLYQAASRCLTDHIPQSKYSSSCDKFPRSTWLLSKLCFRPKGELWDHLGTIFEYLLHSMLVGTNTFLV